MSRLALSSKHPELTTDAICKQKEETTTNDVAVQVIVDCSGSMRYTRLEMAMSCAYGIVQTLERLSIPCEAIGFTTKRMNRNVAAAMESESKRTYVTFARSEALHMPIFKRFEERMTPRLTARFAEYPHFGKVGNTILGEAIQRCHKRIVVRPEVGRLMIVLTDGEPAGCGHADFRAHAKRVIKGIEASKTVDILGVGIDYDVRWLFARAINVPSLSRLPDVLMSELRGFVMKQIH